MRTGSELVGGVVGEVAGGRLVVVVFLDGAGAGEEPAGDAVAEAAGLAPTGTALPASRSTPLHPLVSTMLMSAPVMAIARTCPVPSSVKLLSSGAMPGARRRFWT